MDQPVGERGAQQTDGHSAKAGFLVTMTELYS
jgi:hypothetical protein